MDRLPVWHANVLVGAEMNDDLEPIGPSWEWFLYGAAAVIAMAASAVWPMGFAS